MKRLMLAALPALLITGVMAAPASASGALYCQVISNHTHRSGGLRAGSCGPSVGDSSYVLDYGVAGGAAPYSWVTPQGYPIIGGCDSSTPFCDLVAYGTFSDQAVTVLAWSTPTGTVSATAYIPAVCGPDFC